MHTTYKANSKESKALRRKAGVFLKHCRTNAGLTQRELAKLVDIDYYTFISQLECGQGRVPPNLYVPLAQAMGINLTEFTKTMLQYYAPFTYHALYGIHPYAELMDDERTSGSNTNEKQEIV